MAENWKEKAIHNQFDVFESLSESFQNIPGDALQTLTNAVNTKITQHLLTNNDSNVKTVREISAEIIKNSGDKEKHNIQLSFCVIFTNQYVENNLCKWPIFIIMSDNQSVFVDMSCSAYESWTDFMNYNGLPACEFCYPTNGHYNVSGKLNVDFAKSPASLLSLPNRTLTSRIEISRKEIAGSYFFNIPSFIYRCAVWCGPLVNIFERGMSATFEIVLRLISQVQRCAIATVRFLYDSAFFVLRKILDVTTFVLKKGQQCFKKVYDIISGLFCILYSLAPRRVQHCFAAVAFKVDSSIRSVENKFKMLCSGKKTENEKMFDNCKNESTLDIKKKTEELLTLSKHVADVLQSKTLSDAKDIFETVSSVIISEYTSKMEMYERMVNTVRATANQDIDIEIVNKNLGIVGEPCDHYWIESIQAVKKLHNAIDMKEKIKESKNQEKPYMVQVYKKSEHDLHGLYLIYGVQDAGLLSPTVVLSTLRDNNINLNEETLETNEDNSELTIFISEEYTVLVTQQVLEANSYVGSVIVTSRGT